MSKELYLEENKQLLQFILEERFFKVWRNKDRFEEREKSLLDETKLELYLTTTCNQNCEYCYLQKHKNELYPQEYNKKEIILENLETILQWIFNNGFYIPVIELYSGEIWEYDFGLEVLDIVYKYLLKGLKTDMIMIPSNCSFLRNEKSKQLIQRRINNYKKIGKRLCFSISVDGKIVEDLTRPYNDGSSKDDLFYEDMFLFAQHNKFYFHPMVAPQSVHKWIENFKWWESQFEKYYLNPEENLMMLEVRDGIWTEEQINYYNEFMNFLIDRFLEKLGTPKDFVLCMTGDVNKKDVVGGYVPYMLTESETFPGCGIANTLHIRVGDLAICPCHRTAYNKYLYGYLVKKENEIVDIVPNNTAMAIRTLFGNNNLCSFGCDTCIFNKYCLKGCYGSQLESTQDPFMPVPNICNFFKKKFINLIDKYEEIGIFKELENINYYQTSYKQAQNILKFKKEVDKYRLGKNI